MSTTFENSDAAKYGDSIYAADKANYASSDADVLHGWVTCTPEGTESDSFSSYTLKFDISPSVPVEVKNTMVELIDRFSTFGSAAMFNAFSKHGLKPKSISLSFTGSGLKYSFTGFNTEALDVMELVQRTMQEINHINKMEQNAQNETWMKLLKKYYK
ncbi:MAG TPA: hypothetical protein DEB31_01945 [Clostridiales bacterium]|nr:hypothetical protein [Clostridiales bacterium]